MSEETMAKAVETKATVADTVFDTLLDLLALSSAASRQAWEKPVRRALGLGFEPSWLREHGWKIGPSGLDAACDVVMANHPTRPDDVDQ